MCYYSTRCIPYYKFLHFIYSKSNPLFRDTIIITLIFHIRFLERIAPLFGYNVKVSAVYSHFRVWKVKRTISTLLSKSTYKNKKKKNENNIYIISVFTRIKYVHARRISLTGFSAGKRLGCLFKNSCQRCR